MGGTQNRVAAFLQCIETSDRNEKYKPIDQTFIFGNSENINFVVLAYSPQFCDLQALSRESSLPEWAEELDDIQM